MPREAGAAAQSHSQIEKTIEAQVAEMIAGINTKHAELATKYDAPDLIFMESNSPPILGPAADREGFVETFARSPSWHITKIDETVDVSKAGDMAIYRSTYDENSLDNGVPMTHRVNYIAGFKPDPNGVWRVHWAVVSPQSRSHKR
jgi:ketosteroid isomerase-like protein